MITSDAPLISCIMPTRNRPQFLQQAIASFLSQDYPHKELIIVDCSDKPTVRAEYPGVRSVSITEPLSVGMMRNIACSLAQGNVICHWDDDNLQFEKPNLRGGANRVSLNEARRNFRRHGASQRRL